MAVYVKLNKVYTQILTEADDYIELLYWVHNIDIVYYRADVIDSQRNRNQGKLTDTAVHAHNTHTTSLLCSL